MSRGGLPILTYHALDDSGGVTATSPRWFARTMAALHCAGFRAVDLEAWIDRGRPDVARSFALAFDDGLASIGRAAEVLAGYGWPATAFLVAGRMGETGLLSWADLGDLRAAGFRFAAHTMTHARLDRCDGRALEAELAGSRDAIEQRVGRPCRLLAYPYGVAPGRVRRAAARHFAAAFGTRLDEASRDEDVHAISRVDAYYLRSPRVLDGLISGRWRGWLRARRALRSVRRAVAG